MYVVVGIGTPNLSSVRPSIGLNLQPFIGNGESRAPYKGTILNWYENPQTNKLTSNKCIVSTFIFKGATILKSGRWRIVCTCQHELQSSSRGSHLFRDSSPKRGH